MILRRAQIENILNQISKNVLLYIGVNLGEPVLSLADRALLTGAGVKIAGLGGAFPYYYRMFLLGRLTRLIGDVNSQTLTYSDFEAYLMKHQYQPLTPFETIQYEIARHAAYRHLKNLENRMRSDVEGSISDVMSRSEYEAVFNKQLTIGVIERKSVSNIVSDIGHQTGDWSKDLGRIVDTEMNNIFQQGRAVQLTQANPGVDPEVYKDVYEGACRHCIALYLTDGLGSEPRVFKLSQLIANGTNIGRKVEDWRATLTGVHPWCRCHLRQKLSNTVWDKTKHQFVYDKAGLEAQERALGIRGKVKVTVGDKVFEG
jgi:hypothetical protein